MMFPKVTVIVPVYNQEKYIRECIDSILIQDYENLEIIVVDDGSTDSTPDILKSYGSAICYIRQDNQGAATALNHGLRQARGELVAWLSSDDAYLPQKISKQVAKFAEDPSLSLVYTDWIMIDAYGNEIRTIHSPYPPAEDFALELLKANFVNGSSVLMKKEKCVEVNYFNEKLVADVDGDMWFRLLKHGCRFGHVPALLLKYRWHAGNQSHNRQLMQTYMDRVRYRVIETFRYEEIFKSTDHNAPVRRQNYERLAWILLSNGHISASQSSLQQACLYGKLSPLGYGLRAILNANPNPHFLQRLFALPRFFRNRRLYRDNPLTYLFSKFSYN